MHTTTLCTHNYSYYTKQFIEINRVLWNWNFIEILCTHNYSYYTKQFIEINRVYKSKRMIKYLVVLISTNQIVNFTIHFSASGIRPELNIFKFLACTCRSTEIPMHSCIIECVQPPMDDIGGLISVNIQLTHHCVVGKKLFLGTQGQQLVKQIICVNPTSW